jgi:ankyrin repeat protein
MEQQGGTTALEAAAGRGNVESVRLLLAKGASVNTKDKLSRTPSMVAAARGHNSILRLLAEKGADLKTVDRERQHATHVGGEERQTPRP